MSEVYLATSDGLVVVSRRGDQWHARRPVAAMGPASAVAVEPESTDQPESPFSGRACPPGAVRAPSRRVFCATAAGAVWRGDLNRSGQADDWREVFNLGAVGGDDFTYDRITSLAVGAGPGKHPDGGGDAGRAIYVGTEPSAVFASDDGGAAWRRCEGLTDLPSSGEWRFPPRPQTHHVRWIEADPHAPGLLYAAIEAGALVRTPDGGRTWRDRTPGGPWDTHQLATHRDAPGRVWSAAGDGFFQSDDYGQTWRKTESGLDHRYCWSVALDPTEANGAMIVSAASGPRQAHDADRAEGHLYRRVVAAEAAGDPGKAGHGTRDFVWREVRDGLPDPKGTRTYALAAAAPAEAGVFFAAADADALYQSTDGGASWRRLDVAWPTGYPSRPTARVHVIAAR